MPTLCRNVAKQLSCHASYSGGRESSVLVQLHLIPSSVLFYSCVLFVYFLNTMSVSEDGKGSLWLSFTSKFRALSTRLKPLRYLHPCGGPPEHFTGTRTLACLSAVPQDDYKQHVSARDSTQVMFLWEHEIHQHATRERKRR
jgi:hypothetical protein